MEQRVLAVYRSRCSGQDKEILGCSCSFYILPFCTDDLEPFLLVAYPLFLYKSPTSGDDWDQGSYRAPPRVCFGHSELKYLSANLPFVIIS